MMMSSRIFYRLRRYRIHLTILALILISLYYLRDFNDFTAFSHDSQPQNPQDHQTIALKNDATTAQENELLGNAPAGHSSSNDAKHDLKIEPGFQVIGRSGASRIKNGDEVDQPLLPAVKSLPRSPEKFPVPPKSLIGLPKPVPDSLGKVQATFSSETSEKKKTRLARQQKVKDALLLSWDVYKKNAWGFDEVRPVSLKPFNPFLGKASVVVDALDTLQIMGLDDQYKEALELVANLDFTTTFRDDIPLFETVIRYLGGLISSYDLSGQKDSILLEKAVECADNLIGAFDTPNRMPLLYFKWGDSDTKLRYRARSDAVFSEIASLSLEFTRLAQLTGNNTYYDAIARITNAIYDLAPKTGIPWLYPQIVDASGCEVEYDTGKTQYSTMEDVRRVMEEESFQQQLSRPKNFKSLVKTGKKNLQGIFKRAAIRKQSEVQVLVDNGREQFQHGTCKETEAIKLARAPKQVFTFGGLVDSAYEYFMKQYQLLKGGEPKYKEMYEKMVDQAREHIIFKPKVPNNDDILFMGSKVLMRNGKSESVNEMGHLTCFAGGMFALGGKLLGRPEDVDLGARVTRGCVWAYNATRLGVMPETFTVDACPGGQGAWDAPCEFKLDEMMQEGAVDPGHGSPSIKKHDLVPDHKGGQRWKVSHAYDQPLSFHRMNPMYMLRPEALESVFYMYRISGDSQWQDDGFKMFESILNLCAVKDEDGKVRSYSGVLDVTNDKDIGGMFLDVAESFWMGETLKYAYLLFSEPELLSLDDYVFNTEAHPFKLDA